MRIAAIGIVLFILLPTLRVLLMLLVFIREGDFRLAAAAGLVLAIIVLAIFLGFRATSGIAGPIARTTWVERNRGNHLDLPEIHNGRDRSLIGCKATTWNAKAIS
jgi:hypothetical protein